MAKGRSVVMAEVFDNLCRSLGPRSDGGDARVAKILYCSTKSVYQWRTGNRACPRRVYELLRLTLEERMRVYRHMTGKYRSAKFAASGTRLSASVGLFYGASANDEFQVHDLTEQM